MATCDIPTLVNGSKCYDCIVDQGLFWAVATYLLCKTVQGVQVNCDPETLANDARCFACEIPAGYLPSTFLNVLCQLNQGSSGATCLQCSDSDPVDGVDVPPCDCSLWVTNKAGVPNLWKSSDGATWQPIIWSP